jgi:hypothetical protein
MGKMRNAYTFFVGKPEGKRPVERPRCSWNNNIKMDLREIVCEVVDWINLAQNMGQWRAVVYTVINFLVR